MTLGRPGATIPPAHERAWAGPIREGYSCARQPDEATKTGHGQRLALGFLVFLSRSLAFFLFLFLLLLSYFFFSMCFLWYMFLGF
jgi:hypothetical protein